jgi:hypothetical protein
MGQIYKENSEAKVKRNQTLIFAIIQQSMNNQDLVLYGGIVIVAIVVGTYLFFWFREKRKVKSLVEKHGGQALNLQLQAYERLVLLAERISLPSLVTRIPAGDLSTRQMQGFLTEQIKNEFDYNTSQQIYVSPQAWQAITNLKEQNIFIINQLANAIGPDSKGSELSKKIIELLNADPKVSLHPVVLEALNFEAKKLM